MKLRSALISFCVLQTVLVSSPASACERAASGATLSAYRTGTLQSYTVCSELVRCDENVMTCVSRYSVAPQHMHETCIADAYEAWLKSERLYRRYLAAYSDRDEVRDTLVSFAHTSSRLAGIFLDRHQLNDATTVLKSTFELLTDYGTETVFTSGGFQRCSGMFLRYVSMQMSDGNYAQAKDELNYIGSMLRGKAVSVKILVSMCNNKAIEYAKEGRFPEALLFINLSYNAEKYFPFSDNERREYKRMFTAIGTCFNLAANAGDRKSIRSARACHEYACGLFNRAVTHCPEAFEQYSYISGQVNTLLRLYKKNDMKSDENIQMRRDVFHDKYRAFVASNTIQAVAGIVLQSA